MMKFIKKYSIYIIIVLFSLLFLKTCQSCNRSSQLTWEISKVESYKDSCESLKSQLKDTIFYYENLINEKDGTIVKLESDKTVLNSMIESNQKDKDKLYSILKENQKNINKEK